MNFDISKLRNYVSSRKDASNTFSIPPITESKIIDCLKNISSNKASGIDNISARMLKLAAPIIAPSIAKLTNCSFDTSVFPQRWKTAKVTPLFKGGDTESVNNYRPISVLPVLSKVIERHVHDSLYGYLMDNNLIYSKQSGFRKRHSTETALIGIIDELLFNLDNDRVSGMILIDYCKAFDMVDHSILLQKLQAYGLDDKSINWFRSYLNERLQLVSMGNKESPTACVRHGVPQGSILGPLLFIAFINDLPLHVSSAQIDLYADDTTVTSTANYGSVDFLQSSLTTAISEVDQWATANKLPLNESKTKVLTVTALERIVASQIRDYLTENDLYPSLQSAYRKFHSTETALLRVQNDILRAIDNGNEVLLVLLDLSAAFHKLDHVILINRLSTQYGFTGTVLDWFRSYLNDRSQKVVIGNTESKPQPLTSGVPQGSVLGPL
ncbi:hypothetical protein ACROYT_G038209 [Oculina patagonica]